jgi:hypothetical protein
LFLVVTHFVANAQQIRFGFNVQFVEQLL